MPVVDDSVPIIVRTDITRAWSLITSSTTALQSIGSITVSSGKKLRVNCIIIEAFYTTLDTTAAFLGDIRIRLSGSTKLGPYKASNTTSGALFGIIISIPDGWKIDSDTALDAVCTPAVVTSITWIVNIIGYEY